jgi:hypothetical protein
LCGSKMQNCAPPRSSQTANSTLSPCAVSTAVAPIPSDSSAAVHTASRIYERYSKKRVKEVQRGQSVHLTQPTGTCLASLASLADDKLVPVAIHPNHLLHHAAGQQQRCKAKNDLKIQEQLQPEMAGRSQNLHTRITTLSDACSTLATVSAHSVNDGRGQLTLMQNVQAGLCAQESSQISGNGASIAFLLQPQLRKRHPQRRDCTGCPCPQSSELAPENDESARRQWPGTGNAAASVHTPLLKLCSVLASRRENGTTDIAAERRRWPLSAIAGPPAEAGPGAAPWLRLR